MLVGKNDKGKSTIIDALKLLTNVLRYAPYRSGYLEDRDIPFSQVNLRYNYIERDSVVCATFSDDLEVEVVFPREGRAYIELKKNALPIIIKGSSREHLRNSLGVIPPVGTFEESEKIGDRLYLQKVLVSYLTPRHFRNIWYQFNDGFEEFQKILKETWPGYIIEPPEFDKDQNKVTMFFRENGMTREIFWGGHGFQVWLQLMTFLVKLGKKETLILDEPDIYLHSDMQKQLVNICKERSNQVIIATHAVDIIEEVEPSDVLLIDKDSKTAQRLANVGEVQTCITQLGSNQNLKLAHFIRGKTCLFVEGSDFRYLKAFAKKINIQSFAREQGFSVIPLEGLPNWERLLHIDWLFINVFREKVKCYVVLDRDYYTRHEVDEIISSLQLKGVKAHVWERKEIENYAIDFDALYRVFSDKYRKRYGDIDIPLSNDQFVQELLSIFEECKHDVLSQTIAREIEDRVDRSVDPSTITSKVLVNFEKSWKAEIEFRKKVISGKDFFAKLNTWLTIEYHIEIPVGHMINSLRQEEITPEIGEIITDFVRLVNSH